MGLIFGLLKRIFKLLLYFAIFVAVVLLIPNLPPYTKFTKIELEPTLPRVGGLSPNEDLNNAQKLFPDKLIGPENFRIFNGELYTGLATGEIVKISPGGHVTFVTKIGKPCTGLTQEHICGRPLGFEIDEKNKLLYVADAYYGIWKVDLKTDKKQLLVSPNVEIDGKQVKLFNSIAFDKNGDLYWTHSSSDYDLKDGAMTCLSDPSGRLLHYNSAKNQSKVLLDNLWFANGVAVSPNSEFVLVAETHRYRVMKYYINGSKKGKSEVFIAGLPGVPDNLHVLPDGSGVLVILYVVFDNENPLITRSLSSTPLARKFLARLNRIIEIPFELLHEQYPHVVLEDIIYKIGHFSSTSSVIPYMSGIIQLDWNGNIVASYINTDKSVGCASDVIVYNDKLYIGSPHLAHIATVTVPPLLKKAFTKNEAFSGSATKNDEVNKSAQKTIESAPTAKIVKSSEQVKVVEKKDVPIASKPSVQKSPEAGPSHKSSEQKLNANSHQEKKGNQGPNKKDKTGSIKQESEIKQKPKKTEDTGAKQKVNSRTPTVKESDNLKKTEETPKPDPKKVDGKQKTHEKLDKSSKEKSNEKPVTSEPAKAPHVKQPQPKIVSVKSTTEKPKAKIEKESSGTKSPNTEFKAQHSVPDQIPVKENIPSDRVKPNEEKLKVIKKSGPVEIPNPN